MWDQSLDVSDSQERISYLKQIRKNKKTASACGLPVTRVQAPLQRSWLPLLWLWFMRVCVCTLSHSVVSDSWWPHGLKPARLLCSWNSPGKHKEWVAISFSRGSSQLRNRSLVSCIAGRLCTSWATREALLGYEEGQFLLFNFSTVNTIALFNTHAWIISRLWALCKLYKGMIQSVTYF